MIIYLCEAFVQKKRCGFGTCFFEVERFFDEVGGNPREISVG